MPARRLTFGPALAAVLFRWFAFRCSWHAASR
ncbi:hypothetical protein RPHASCH2410_PD03970 (plasmid) [Rhizobium phaseoli Ch24-10]|nr:hypothetical protein RPHASCH2410_PD03970 [Rhizobium phaseoli Ch24-10]